MLMQHAKCSFLITFNRLWVWTSMSRMYFILFSSFLVFFWLILSNCKIDFFSWFSMCWERLWLLKILVKILTIMMQSNVSKLEDKQNYKIWNIWICSLLKFKNELVIIKYISRFKKTESVKNQKNMMKAALALAKKLWKTEILLLD